MSATADTIWQVPAYLPYLQPALTAEAISSVEKKIGHKLPAEYLELLKKQNGGYIRYSLPEMAHDTIAGIGPHYPSLTLVGIEECQEYVSFPLQGLVPFDGDGHWYVCLDYRRNATTPSVTYVDIECDRQSGIAGTFGDYLAMLEIDVGAEYVLEKVSDIETLKARLSKAMEIGFGPPDSWAHGFPIQRAALGTKDRSEWLWISPNLVPRGFVRPEDPRYAELKDLMPGHAARFPELPADSYILTATEGVLPRVLKVCAESKLPVRHLREFLSSG